MLVPIPGSDGSYEYDPSIPEGSGGGGDITVESLSVTENDTYTAPSGKAYSPVIVNVPSGGGGGGDVTWAKVTFINADTSTMYYVDNLIGIVNTGYFEVISGMGDIPVQDEHEVTVPLYKGKYAIPQSAFQSIDTSYFPQFTGGVTLDMESQFIVVTGDGTMTCKGIRWD